MRTPKRPTAETPSAQRKRRGFQIKTISGIVFSYINGYKDDIPVGLRKLFLRSRPTMRTRFHLSRLILLIAIMLISTSFLHAQDPELVRHFDYDQKGPLGITET